MHYNGNEVQDTALYIHHTHSSRNVKVESRGVDMSHQQPGSTYSAYMSGIGSDERYPYTSPGLVRLVITSKELQQVFLLVC